MAAQGINTRDMKHLLPRFARGGLEPFEAPWVKRRCENGIDEGREMCCREKRAQDRPSARPRSRGRIRSVQRTLRRTHDPQTGLLARDNPRSPSHRFLGSGLLIETQK